MKENVKINNKEKIIYFLFKLLDFVTAAFIGAVIYCFITKNTPDAIDVYRGKITLEIIYRDSIAVDSIVVYKVK